MKLTDLLAKLPPSGTYLGTRFATDMNGRSRECIMWAWTDAQGTYRKGYFAISDGAYVGDLF